MDDNQDRIDLGKLFGLERKNKVEKYIKGKRLYGSDFGDFLLLMQYFPLRYWHFPIYNRIEPSHLQIELENLDCLQPDCNGKEETQESVRKLLTRINQLSKERRLLATHFFPRLDLKRWHLIYFDQRDTNKHDSHWRWGSHMHFASSLWHRCSIEEIWEEMHRSKPNYPASLHIPYCDDLSVSYH
ncbi:MAG: hypothetical protein GF309_03385 [Candidatus Lokiarchaeota archaeon]|nr:hypothetical protein [Candidatus Lokiarchaeota archaeon]